MNVTATCYLDVTSPGLVTAPPIAATIEAMLDDVAAYASWAAHFGAPPAAWRRRSPAGV